MTEFLTKLSLLVFMSIIPVLNAAEIFSDNFSNGTLSNQQWALSTTVNAATPSYSGIATLTNNSTLYMNFLKHVFTGTKPSTFSFSATIIPQTNSGGAGIIFCMGSTGFLAYTLQLNDNYIYANKYLSSGAPTLLFSRVSSWIRSDTNSILVSKNGTSFVVYCNGHYMGSFSDATAPYTSGDIGLIMPTSSTVKYDNVLVTDQIDVARPDSCFADSFNDGVLYPWTGFSFNNGATIEQGGFLTVSNLSTNVSSGIYVDLSLVQFRIKVEVCLRHRHDGKIYGLLVKGTTNTTVPYCVFGITGNGGYAISSTVKTISGSRATNSFPYVDPGRPTDTAFYTDTLEVIKSAGANNYLFIVNGIDTVSHSFDGIDFSVDGVGIYCQDSIAVRFDNFSAYEQNSSCASTRVKDVNPRFNISRPSREVPLSRKSIIFDIQGREIAQYSEQALNALPKGTYMITGKNKELLMMVVKVK